MMADQGGSSGHRKRSAPPRARRAEAPEETTPAAGGDESLSVESFNAAFAELFKVPAELGRGTKPAAAQEAAATPEAASPDTAQPGEAGDTGPTEPTAGGLPVRRREGAPAPPPPPVAAADAESDAGLVDPLGVVEAVIFVGDTSGEPLTAERIAAIMRGIEPADVEDLVRRLNHRYAEDHCPYRIELERGGYRLALRSQFERLRDRFYGRVRQAKLSQAAVEVLAAVAYHQPMTADELTELRGKGSSGLLNQLVRRQLLRIQRDADNPRLVRYHTTDRFLHVFGLESLADLPRSEDPSVR